MAANRSNRLPDQTYDKCGDMELTMMECLEAYGMQRGIKMCKDYNEDFQECFGMKKQLKRFHAMRHERTMQLLRGQRKLKEKYAKAPRVDAY